MTVVTPPFSLIRWDCGVVQNAMSLSLILRHDNTVDGSVALDTAWLS